jgi:nitrile hydratase accessory protein
MASLTGHPAALLPIRRDDDGPIFAEPWQAEAFALAVQLSAQGHFTPQEWAHTLAAELQLAAARGELDGGARFYHYWLAAFERLIVAKGLSDPATLLERKEAWAEAFRRNPHGKLVRLEGESSS